MSFRIRGEGERRSSPRFDRLGELWGALEWQESSPLRNIGHGGAMVEGRQPLALESEHVLRFQSPSRTHPIRARALVVRLPGDHQTRQTIRRFLARDEERAVSRPWRTD